MGGWLLPLGEVACRKVVSGYPMRWGVSGILASYGELDDPRSIPPRKKSHDVSRKLFLNLVAIISPDDENSYQRDCPPPFDISAHLAVFSVNLGGTTDVQDLGGPE
jgi:hypothetical protein